MTALPLFRIELVQSDFKWLKKVLNIPNQQATLSQRNDKSAMWHNGKAFISTVIIQKQMFMKMLYEWLKCFNNKAVSNMI